MSEQNSSAVAEIKKTYVYGAVRRVGPDKGGHWEVIEKIEN